MVATIDVTQAQYYIPEIWGNESLPILRQNVVIAPNVMRDTEIAAFARGDVLHIPYPGTLSPSAKTAGTAYTLAQPSGETEVQVTLNKYYATSFLVEDVVRAEAVGDYMSRFGEAAAIGMADQIESDLLTALQAASHNVGTYGTAVTFDGLLAAWKEMSDNKCPRGGRYVAVGTKDIVSLAGDTDLQNWAAFARGGQIAGDPTQLGPVAGFDNVLYSQSITTSAATPAQTDCVAWRRDGIVLAMRTLPDPPAGSGALAQTFRDPDSGLMFKVTTSYSPDYGGVRVTYEALYGVKILEEAKVLLVKS